VLGSSEFANPARALDEDVLFAVYGVSALIYRFFLYFGIVVGIYSRFDKLVGIVLALVALSLFVGRPLVRSVTSVWEKRKDLKPRPKEALIFLALLGVLVPLLIWPWSSRSVFPCFMDSSKIQKLTVPLHTSILEVFIREGMPVKKGALLFQLEPTALKLELVRKQVDREIILSNLRLSRLDEKEKTKAPGQEIELARADAGVKKITQELDLAVNGIRAPFSGVVTLLDPRVQQGFMPGKGTVVGELKSPSDCVVHALVPGRYIHDIQEGQSVEIWFPINGGTLFKKTIDEVKSYSEKNLPDSAFSSRFGGEIATEPEGRGALDVPLDDYFVCSVHFPENQGIPLGMTGKLVVSAPPEGALSRLVDTAVQTLNRESLF
jgi:putative peptide zinc metalloprotease protein